ncbi:MAG: hypothetical protein JNL90_16540 [Planctomycetes bacterium]|nr:hypothetical protein [Planctomycetota bacterium]
MPLSRPEFLPILRAFLRAKVEFIVIGGVAANLHGSPMITFDVDLVPRRSLENFARTIEALTSLDAWYREHGDKRLRPTVERLQHYPGTHLLETRHGRLDLLGAVSGGAGYDELLERTVWFELDPGERLRTIDLEALIELKRSIGREKDRSALLLLEEVLAERRRLGMPRDG